MELSKFAQHILCSESLADKLWQPENPLIETAAARIGEIPTQPTRESRIKPAQLRHRRIKPSVVSGNNLESVDDRIFLLHSFANHELLAMELFAWLLLKFPDAPPTFRKGIAGIMLDEQRHCRLYCNRLKELGVEFGSLPLNDFMWRSLACSETIEQFIAGMSLTFEQANLDYAAHYAKQFALAGDSASAAILNLVFTEEINHVKHGVHWSEKLNHDHTPTIHFHMNHLVPPLSLARAQGTDFQREARIAAGLDDAYITRLQTYSSSKGRPPRVFLFNPTYELESIYKTNNYSQTKPVEQLEKDLACLTMHLAHADDVVMVAQRPSDEFLLTLKDWGIASCDFYETDFRKFDANIFSERYQRLTKLEPWGWSPRARQILEPLLNLLPNKEQHRLMKHWHIYDSAERAPWIGKSAAASIRNSCTFVNDPVSQLIQVVRSSQDLAAALNEIMKPTTFGPHSWVAKAPLGASGNQQLRFSRDVELTPNQFGWIYNTIRGQGSVILEPWVEKHLDLSVVGEVNSETGVKVWGITRFITDSKGHYLGHHLGHPLRGINDHITRQAHLLTDEKGNSISYADQLTRVAKFVGESLLALGYSGPFGVDAFLYDASPWPGTAEVQLQPLVEINTRWTMGHIAFQLRKKLAAHGYGVWTHLMRPQLERQGFTTFAEFAAHMQSQYPRRFLATNDPAHAQQCLSYVIFNNDA